MFYSDIEKRDLKPETYPHSLMYNAFDANTAIVLTAKFLLSTQHFVHQIITL